MLFAEQRLLSGVLATVVFISVLLMSIAASDTCSSRLFLTRSAHILEHKGFDEAIRFWHRALVRLPCRLDAATS